MIERYTQPAIDEHARRYNVAPGQQAPVITASGTQLLRWGLLSPWQGHGGKRRPPVHVARIDTLESTPMLRRAKRCIVVGDGWFAKEKIKKHTHAWWIHGATGFAGVMATHADDGVPSFAIVVAPSTLRSPLLPCGADELWLRDGVTFDVVWREVEVSRYFEDVSRDDRRCIEPVGNPNQGSLF